jgi:prophage regulatory protein
VNEKPILRVADVCTLLSITQPTLYRWMHAGTFPKGIHYSTRCVGWERATVEAWLAEKKLASNSAR